MNNPTTDSRPNQTDTKERTQAADEQASRKSSHFPGTGKEADKDKPEPTSPQNKEPGIKPSDTVSHSGRNAPQTATKNPSQVNAGGASASGTHSDTEEKAQAES
jgi:hypothetical protein